MDHSYSISYKDIVLNPISKDDIEDLRELRNSQRFCFSDSNYIESKSQEKWFENYLQSKNDFMFRIDSLSSFRLGYIALYNIDRTNNSAEFGRIVVRKNSNGIGTKAIIAILNFAKTTVCVDKVFCFVKKTNEKANNVYKRIGFVMFKSEADYIFYCFDLNNFNVKHYG